MPVFRDVHGRLYRIPSAELESYAIEDEGTHRVSGAELPPTAADYQWPDEQAPSVEASGYLWPDDTITSAPAGHGTRQGKAPLAAGYQWNDVAGYQWNADDSSPMGLHA